VQDITLELIPAVNSRRSIRDADPSVTPKLVAINSAKYLAADLSATALSLDAELEGASAAAGDRAALAAMAGRYVGQIDARIERAWLRPRTAIGAPAFLCRVRITQDRGGNVLGVGVERCNGTRRWQRSLIAAIETASPLPAPPDPHVFASVVHLGFRALPYTPGSPPGEYEPERLAQAAVISARRSRESADQGLEHLQDALQHPHAHEVIKLTLTGSGAEGSDNLPPVAPRPAVLPPIK
ncbi:MAG: TonB C-terminal domain-containing protein, partial [Steroidobacteraceae bacterium]